jgi:hypothetical protein
MPYRLCIAWLGGLFCLPALADTIRFYLPPIPAIYEANGGKPTGLYVDLLQHMAGHAGVTLDLYLASRPRILQSLQHQSDACTAVTLAANVPPPPGMQYVYPMGQTQAMLFTRPGDHLDLAELANVPQAQRMVFGEGVASVLVQRKIEVMAHSESLQEAVAMLQAQRVRVLFATRAALSRLAPGTLEPGQELGPLVSWFACSRRMPAAMSSRLASAWAKVPLPRF